MTTLASRQARHSVHKAKPKKLGATKLNVNAEELFDNSGRGLLADVQLTGSKENHPNPTDGIVSPSPVVAHNPLAVPTPHYATLQAPRNPSMREVDSFDELPSEAHPQSPPERRNQELDLASIRAKPTQSREDNQLLADPDEQWRHWDHADAYERRSSEGSQEEQRPWTIEDDMDDDWDWNWNVAGSLGTAIPDKLREIHSLLLEDDDVVAPDELVRPIESLLNQGLEAIGSIGRTALAVGTTVDNALEGAILMVHSAASEALDFGSTSPNKSRSPSSRRSLEGSGAGRTHAASRKKEGRRSVEGSKASSWDDDWEEMGPSPSERLATRSGGGAAGGRAQSQKTRSAEKRSAEKKRATKERADPVLEYEQKAFRLEQLLTELSDDMAGSEGLGELESLEMQAVIDNLTESLRNTQMQCQILRQNQARSKHGAASPASTPAKAAGAGTPRKLAHTTSLPASPPKPAAAAKPPIRRSTTLPTAAAPAPDPRSPASANHRPQSNLPMEEDPLAEQMRMQMEALLAEKARLAYENARLCRENESLHELLDFHHSNLGEQEEEREEELPASAPVDPLPAPGVPDLAAVAAAPAPTPALDRSAAPAAAARAAVEAAAESESWDDEWEEPAAPPPPATVASVVLSDDDWDTVADAPAVPPQPSLAAMASPAKAKVAAQSDSDDDWDSYLMEDEVVPALAPAASPFRAAVHEHRVDNSPLAGSSPLITV